MSINDIIPPGRWLHATGWNKVDEYCSRLPANRQPVSRDFVRGKLDKKGGGLDLPGTRDHLLDCRALGRIPHIMLHALPEVTDKDIAHGLYDAPLRAYLIALKQDAPVLLRPFGEFNFAPKGRTARHFPKAWKRVQELRDSHAPNVLLDWCAMSSSEDVFKRGPIGWGGMIYPHHFYVGNKADYWGLDTFNGDAFDMGTAMGQRADDHMRRARDEGNRVLLDEVACRMGVAHPDALKRFFWPLLDFMELNTDVVGGCWYINVESFEGEGGGGKWPDTRLWTVPAVWDWWLENMVEHPRMIHAKPVQA